MKKTVLFLVLTLALVLSACSNNSGNKSNNENDSKDTVSIKNSFSASGNDESSNEDKKLVTL